MQIRTRCTRRFPRHPVCGDSAPKLAGQAFGFRDKWKRDVVICEGGAQGTKVCGIESLLYGFSLVQYEPDSLSLEGKGSGHTTSRNRRSHVHGLTFFSWIDAKNIALLLIVQVARTATSTAFRARASKGARGHVLYI